MWRRANKAFAEMIYRMRTDGASPARQGFAMGVGAFIGSTPLFGLHLPICLFVARLSRLSFFTMYAGAQVSYPAFAPFVYFAELQLGSLLRRGEWFGIALAELSEPAAAIRRHLAWEFVIDLLVGSIVLGVVLGVGFGFMIFVFARHRAREPERMRVAEAAARPYLESGISDWEWVRGKLKGDPVYFALLGSGLLPERGRLVDLGCGRGILLSLVDAAATLHRAGTWPAEWPPPPRELALHGIEVRPKRAATARLALGGRATIETADLVHAAIPPAAAIALLDVLHYLPRGTEDELIARAAAALEPGGVLLVREADADAGWRFRMVRATERLRATLRGHFRQSFAYRTAGEWRALLERQGLAVQDVPFGNTTPFGNVLLCGRKPGRM